MDNFRHKKKLGQCFLSDHNIARKIVKMVDIKNEDDLWEVGPGGGVLTKFILEQSQNIKAFEIDSALIPILNKKFPDLNLIHADILKVNWSEYLNDKKIKIISNLPYQITSPFLFKAVKFSQNIKSITIMIQREVADRIVAKTGCKDYGILTLKMQFYFNIKFLFKVPRHLFIPQPNVDSAVIQLTPRIDKPQISDEQLLWRIVECSFRNRRKMLRKNLIEIVSKDRISELQNSVNIELSRRGESLNEEEFSILYNSISKLLS